MVWPHSFGHLDSLFDSFDNPHSFNNLGINCIKTKTKADLLAKLNVRVSSRALEFFDPFTMGHNKCRF